MSLYTIMMEYRGGTYISQIKADDQTQALQQWSRDFDAEGIGDISEAERNHFAGKLFEKLYGELYEENPEDTQTPLQGVRSVWCADANVFDDFVIIHTVKTVSR